MFSFICNSEDLKEDTESPSYNFTIRVMDDEDGIVVQE